MERKDVIQKLNRLQAKSVKANLAALETTGRALNVMATGTGKTNVAGKMTASLLKQNPTARILWLTHTQELIAQATSRISNMLPGVSIGVFDAGSRVSDATVTIASIPTLSRKNHLKGFKRETFDYVFVDEAHHAPAASWSRILEHFNTAKRFGFTATPVRPDQDGNQTLLNGLFGEPTFDVRIPEAQKLGVLAEHEAWVILTDSVLNGSKSNSGEYSAKELDRLFVSKDRNETIVKSYKKYGQARMLELDMKPKAICYCINVQHAMRMAELFDDAGIDSGIVVGNQKEQSATNRIDIWDKFKNTNEIEILCAVNVLNEGVDVPDVGCVIMARPTRSVITYQQQFGRGARATVKDKFIVLDYVDNTRTEFQAYLASNIDPKKQVRSRIVTEYLDNQDAVLVEKRVQDVFDGVAQFENRLRMPLGFYTLEYCQSKALEYVSTEAWKRGDRGSYAAANNHGWLHLCTGHMRYVRYGTLTFQYCFDDAQKHSTPGSWRKSNPSAYSKACQKGWLEQCRAHMKDRRRVYGRDFEQCFANAQQYETVKTWRESSGSSYQVARVNGWDLKCSAHMGLRLLNLETGQLFQGPAEAARRLGVATPAICFAINNGTRCRDQRWAYYDPARHIKKAA